MPVTINVNNLTVSHKGSTGTSISFPDVCKTPSPAGPIPIPYPNIAMSSDTMSGSKTVKMDGNELMLKDANMKMSTGDEAGAAMGVVSSKIKGKAEFINYSFDVKVDGKNVCRLSDPTQQNMGCANAAAFFHVQMPQVILPHQMKGCEEAKKAVQKDNNDSPAVAWGKSGVHKPHQKAFEQTAKQFNVTIYIRATNAACVERGWIPDRHQPKPHDVIAAKTISGKNEAVVQSWIARNGNTWKGAPKLLPASALHGVVSSLKTNEVGKPLQAQKGKRDMHNGYSYAGKWITGDYDLMQVVFEGGDCEVTTEASYGVIQYTLNKKMGWSGIQHGAQAQWDARAEGEGDFSMPEELHEFLNTDPGTDVPGVKIAEGRPKLAILDEKLTRVGAGKVMHLKTAEDSKNALICEGCAK
jgi:hypothetical protein